MTELDNRRLTQEEGTEALKDVPTEELREQCRRGGMSCLLGDQEAAAQIPRQQLLGWLTATHNLGGYWKDKLMKKQLDPRDVCIALHTALRKQCSSDTTTAAYYLIHLEQKEKLKKKHDPWRLFGVLVAEQLKLEAEPVEAVRLSIEQLEDAWYDRVIKPRADKGKNSPIQWTNWTYTLLSILKCFDDRDLGGFAYYLKNLRPTRPEPSASEASR